MKKLTLTALLAMILVAGCGDPDRRGNITPDSQPKSEIDYNVNFLFETDGVKIYRFTDPSSRCYIYFTVPSGETYYEYSTGGKVKRTQRVQCINAKKQKQ